MLTATLLLFSIAGLQAIPIRHDNSGIKTIGETWNIKAPNLVQVEPQWEVVLAPANEVTQDKMNSHNPQALFDFRQGTQNSHATLVDIRSGQVMPELSEMDRKANVNNVRQDSKPSRRFLVDLNTGLLKEHISHNPQALSDFRQGTQNSHATLVDIRSGQVLPELSEMDRKANVNNGEDSKPSRRFPVDLNTGLLKEHISHNPQALSDFRQGTQNSHATLVDIRSGQVLPELSEMDRKANVNNVRQDSKPSRRFLVDLNTGLLKEHISHNPQALFDFRQGTQNSHATLVDIRSGQVLPELSEMDRKANVNNGEHSKPSRRFPVDLNTGLLKEHISHNPQALSDFRQGTQNSHPTFVDIWTGQQLSELSEMKKNANYYSSQAHSEFRQGTQNSQATLVDIRTDQQLTEHSEMQRKATSEISKD